MKNIKYKILILILCFFSLFFIGCGSKGSFNEFITSTPTVIKIDKEYSLSTDYDLYYEPFQQLQINEGEEINNFINQINKISFTEETTKKIDISKYNYVIEIGLLKICVVNDYFYMNSNLYRITKNNFDFIDKYNWQKEQKSESCLFSELGFISSTIYKLENNEKNLKYIDTNDSLKSVLLEYVLTKDNTNYDKFIYIIEFGNKEVKVVSNSMFVYDNRVYHLTKGSFDILNSYDYSKITPEIFNLKLDSSNEINVIKGNENFNITEKNDIESIIGELNKIKYQEQDEVLTEKLFTFTVNNTRIEVYENNIFTINDKVCLLVEGNFDLIKNYEISDGNLLVEDEPIDEKGNFGDIIW